MPPPHAGRLPPVRWIRRMGPGYAAIEERDVVRIGIDGKCRAADEITDPLMLFLDRHGIEIVRVRVGVASARTPPRFRLRLPVRRQSQP